MYRSSASEEVPGASTGLLDLFSCFLAFVGGHLVDLDIDSFEYIVRYVLTGKC